MNQHKPLDWLGLRPAGSILISSASVLLRGKGRAQPVSSPIQAKGQRQEEASHPLCPAMTKQQSSCHMSVGLPQQRVPKSRNVQPSTALRSPSMEEIDRCLYRSSGNSRGWQGVSLSLPLEKSSSPCCSLTRLKYTPVSLRLLALSPYPKKRLPNLDKMDVFVVLGPSGRETWWYQRQSHPLPLEILIFLLSARTNVRWHGHWSSQNVHHGGLLSLQNGCW